MILTRHQISFFVNKVGQPHASVLLNNFFKSYCRSLESHDVTELYDDDYANRIASHKPYRIIDNKYKINIYNKYTYEYLKSRCVEGDIVLDYGCGNGDFSLAVSSSLGVNVHGIDFDHKVISQAKDKLRSDQTKHCMFYENLNELQHEHKFNFIILNDVVEHLSDRELKKLFTELKQNTLPDTTIIIHTPNALAICNDTEWSMTQWLYKCYLSLFKGWRGFERTIDQLYYDQVHINIKSFRSLAYLLKVCGYDAEVLYDTLGANRLLNSLSSNMLVIAKPSLME